MSQKFETVIGVKDHPHGGNRTTAHNRCRSHFFTAKHGLQSEGVISSTTVAERAKHTVLSDMLIARRQHYVVFTVIPHFSVSPVSPPGDRTVQVWSNGMRKQSVQSSAASKITNHISLFPQDKTAPQS